MKKIKIALIGLMLYVVAGFTVYDAFAPLIPRIRPWGTSTTMTDSTSYVVLNKGFYIRDSLIVGKDGYIKGKLYLDTNREGSIEMSGNDLIYTNLKSAGVNYFYTTGRTSSTAWLYSAAGSHFLMNLDTTGLEITNGDLRLSGSTRQLRVPSTTASDGDTDDDITANTVSGIITTKALTTAAGSSYTFTLENSLISATTKLFVQVSGGTKTTGLPLITVANPGSGSASITITNVAPLVSFDGTIEMSFFLVN